MEIGRVSKSSFLYPSVGPAFSQEELFLAAMTLFMIRLHESVMRTWERFAEVQKELDSRKNHENSLQRERKYEEKISREQALYLYPLPGSQILFSPRQDLVGS